MRLAHATGRSLLILPWLATAPIGKLEAFAVKNNFREIGKLKNTVVYQDILCCWNVIINSEVCSIFMRYFKEFFQILVKVFYVFFLFWTENYGIVIRTVFITLENIAGPFLRPQCILTSYSSYIFKASWCVENIGDGASDIGRLWSFHLSFASSQRSAISFFIWYRIFLVLSKLDSSIGIG